MIVYIPAPSAQPLSEALWRLTDINPTRGTTCLFSSIEDVSSNLWLEVNTETTIPVHHEAELDGIANILQPFIDAGQLPADTNAQLAAYIETNRGGRINVYDAFPQFFKNQAKTYNEMIALGLFRKMTIMG